MARSTVKHEELVSFRLPRPMLERIDRLVPVLASDPANAAWRVSRGAALRLALMEGLAVLEGRYPETSRPSTRHPRRHRGR